VDTLHEEIEHLVGHLVGNDVDTLHEEKNHTVRFSFIRVHGSSHRRVCFLSKLAKPQVWRATLTPALFASWRISFSGNAVVLYYMLVCCAHRQLLTPNVGREKRSRLWGWPTFTYGNLRSQAYQSHKHAHPTLSSTRPVGAFAAPVGDEHAWQCTDNLDGSINQCQNLG